MKRGLNAGLFFILLIALMPFISAEISFDSPKSLYNLGEELDTRLSVSVPSQVSGFLVVKLSCSGEEIELYKSPLSVKDREQRQILFSTFLDKNLISEMKGECVLKGYYSGEQGESRKFTISEQIIVTSEINQSIYNPGSQIAFIGSAIRKNGMPAQGIAELSSQELNILYTSMVKDGKYSFNFSLGNEVPSRSYLLKIKVYERDLSGRVTNQGEGEAQVRVRQILKKADIALNKLSFVPGESVVYTLLATDQAGEEMRADGQIKITDAKGNIISQRVVSSGVTINLKTYSNDTPGPWSIDSEIGQITGKKQFNIQELENASYTINGAYLEIKNSGNVPYSKPIEISIGGKGEIKQVILDVGEKKEFKLSAPDGEYEIEAKANGIQSKIGKSLLTGSVVAVKEQGIFSLTFMPWVWLILIIIALIALYFAYLKFLRPKYSERKIDSSNLGSLSLKPAEYKTGKFANQSPIMEKGKKEKAIILSISLKNYGSIVENEEAKKILERIIQTAKGSGSKVTKISSGILAIYTASTSGQEDITLNAVKAGFRLRNILEEYNKKFTSKIIYGIGLGEGEIIVDNSNGFKFNPLGNSVISAKRLAEAANSEILISDSIHMLTRSKVKVSKSGTGWKVLEIAQERNNTDFVEKFKKRQGFQ